MMVKEREKWNKGPLKKKNTTKADHFQTLTTPSRDELMRKFWPAWVTARPVMASLWPGGGGSGPRRVDFSKSDGAACLINCS